MIIGSIVILVLLSVGAYLIVNSLAPLEKKDTVLNDAFNVAANSCENRTAWATSSGEYVASIAVSEGTINVSWVPTVELWLDGQFTPHWYETDQTDMGFSNSVEPGQKSAIYLVFLNNDTVTKEVQLEVSKVWNETNYIGLLGGGALILSGSILAIVLKYTSKPIRSEEFSNS